MTRASLLIVPVLACLLGCPDKPATPADPADPAAPETEATAAAEDDEEWTPIGDEGLKFQTLVEGDGPVVTSGQTVVTHATGTFPDGKKFWSSLDTGKKIPFPLTQGSVIDGWVQGVPGMKVGGKRKLFVPWKLAYGEVGRRPTIPPRADLVFVIEVFEAK